MWYVHQICKQLPPREKTETIQGGTHTHTLQLYKRANASGHPSFRLDIPACYNSPTQPAPILCSIVTNSAQRFHLPMLWYHTVETKCRHPMCKLCVSRHLLKKQSTKPTCPVCSEGLIYIISDIWPISRPLTGILRKLQVHCDHPRTPVQRMQRVMTEHFLKNCPDNQSRVPAIKKENRSSSFSLLKLILYIIIIIYVQ